MSSPSTSERKMSDMYLIRRLWKYLVHSKRGLTFLIIVMLYVISISIYVPLHVSFILDDAIAAGDISFLILLAAIFLLIMGSGALVGWYARYLFAKIGENAIFELRSDVFEKLQHHDQSYYDNTPTGETISRLTNDINNMTGILNGSVIFALLASLQIIGYLVVMFTRSVTLTLISIIIIPLAIFTMWLNRRYIRTEVAIANREVGEVSASITENIQGARVSAAFSRAEQNTTEFEEINQRLGQTIYRLFRNVSFVSPLNRVFTMGTLLLVIFVGSRMIASGSTEITVGVLFLFITYTQSFSQPVQQLSGVYNQIQNSFASFERVVTLIDEPTFIVDQDNAKDLVVKEGKIELNNVTFSYSEDSDIILNNFNLTISPGEVIAIVGHTGAGKSTITRLISRIYDIQQGDILIDDQKIKEITLSSLRKSIGIVLQEPILFSDTLRFNLTLGAEASDEFLFSILDLIGADFVRELDGGLDTIVGERGSRLSLGQRQLISFARALVPNPPILFLDEATSSIDPQAELRIQRAMDEMLKGRTSIMIAHRLSTVKKADRIIVMSQGKIIEEGSFNELLEQKGEFYELYQLQFNQTKELVA